MAEQLPLDFTASAAQRHRRAVKAAASEEQPTLFAAWAPNIDVHLQSATEAIAQISGSEPERAHHWLAGIVGNIRAIKPRRVAFDVTRLDRLLYLRPPAQITLDAAATAVGRAIWADKLGLKPLRVTRDRQRLLASSPRWPSGFRVKDAPWTAIAAIVHLGLPLDVEDGAQALFAKKLHAVGAKIGAAGLAGSAVVIETSRPLIVENLGLPGLAYDGEPNGGRYKLPLLSAEPLLRQQVVDVPAELRAAIEKATAPVRPLTKLPDYFPWKLYGFQAADAGTAVRILETTGGVLLAGDMGSGKSLVASARIASRDGWVQIRDLKVGDEVFGPDGRLHPVTAVYPQGQRPLYRFTFTDGTTLDADLEHLWAVQSPVQKYRGQGFKVMTTAELLERPLQDRFGNHRWHIPVTKPVEYPAVGELPLDPYLLGTLIGDGYLGRSPTFTTGDPWMAAELRRLLPSGTRLVPDKPTLAASAEAGCPEGQRARLADMRALATRRELTDADYVGYRFKYADKLNAALSELGLRDHRAWEKFIPSPYLHAPVAARVALLQGLLDTDGGLKNGRQLSSIEYTTTSERLARDVAELVQSLGGTARISTPVCKTYTYQGEQRRGRPAWRMSIALPPEVPAPFRLPRKAEQYRPREKYRPTRAIVSIEPAGVDEAVCISIDSPDRLYLAEHYLTTHNTTVSLGLVAHLDIWPLLVVSPLSAFSTWERQLGEMGKNAYLATEAPQKSWEAIETGSHDAVVISFDRLAAFTELIERMHFRGIVADEIQRIRTPGSKRSRALRALASSVPFRIGLSGTPLTNTVNDLLPLGAFLAPGEWRPRANAKDLEDIYPGDPVESVAEHLGALMVRRKMTDTGAKLPKRNDHRIYIQLTPEQRSALAALEAEAEAAKEAGEFDDPSSKLHAFAKLQRMRQIVNSPSAAGVPGPNPKISATISLAKDFLAQGRKGVIFCADRTTFRELGRAMDAEGIGWVGIWGATPAQDRILNEKKFHAGDLAPNGHPTEVVLCTIQAGSESWSASPTGTWLISTAYVYAPSTLSQMECRVYRLSSDVNGPDIEICYIHAQAPGGSLDDRMVEILAVKKQLFAQVVDREDFTDTTKVHYSMADLVYLMTGKRDEKLDKADADAKAAAAREQARTEHARQTLYKHKGRNRTDASIFVDKGEKTVTLEQYRSAHPDMDDADLDDMLDAADHDEDLADVNED